MRSNFRPDNPGYDYDRLRSILANTSLSKDDNALWQLIFGLIDAAQKQEARFITQIQQITNAIQVDDNGNISAKNLAGINTGNVRIASPTGIITPTGSGNQTFEVNNINLITQTTEDGRGLYDPTLTNVTNIAASTAYQNTFCRIGNICYVFGQVDVDPTAAGACELGISFPIASGITIGPDCAGSGASHEVAGFSVAIFGDPTNDRASMQWVAVDTANRRVSYLFGYRVLV